MKITKVLLTILLALAGGCTEEIISPDAGAAEVDAMADVEADAMAGIPTICTLGPLAPPIDCTDSIECVVVVGAQCVDITGAVNCCCC